MDKIIILSLRVGTSRNENSDNQCKRSCAYETDHMSLLCDSTMSSALNFCSYLFYWNLLEDKINSKKTNIYM